MKNKPIISNKGKLAILTNVAPNIKMEGQFSNKTPLAQVKGKLRFICPVCENVFFKPAAWAKRNKNHFCSRACAAAGRIVRYEIPCVVCDKIMSLRFSNICRIKTCSKLCSCKRRRGEETKKTSYAIYKKAVKELTENPTCMKCGCSHGPWRVRNLTVIINENGEASLDKEKVEIWCEHCHLDDIALLGGLCRCEKACSVNHKH